MTLLPSQAMEPSAENGLSERELAAWRGMLEAHAALISRLDAELERDHGLPLSSYEVLMYLSDSEDGRLRMGELAERLLLSRSGITRLVDRLERQGLVERRRCDDDGRGFNAELTEAGWQKIGVARPAHLAGVRRHFLARIEEPELATLASVWARLKERTPAGDE